MIGDDEDCESFSERGFDDEDEDEEDEEEEEEHPASADSAVVIPTIELVSPPEGTKPVIPPPSYLHLTTLVARIIVHFGPFHIPSTRSAGAPCNVMSPSAHSSPPPVPSPLLPSSGSRYEVGESSTARPTGGRRVDYGFVSTLDAEERRRGISEERPTPKRLGAHSIEVESGDHSEELQNLSESCLYAQRDPIARMEHQAKLHTHTHSGASESQNNSSQSMKTSEFPDAAG
ncbi:hypothetical protein Tco_0941193 [Tanacetum coccineum]|uniref:Uncharacterized protein n=1 Tax=Tanacetum coccineum TaxID=301880 RepID=A0ABQ5DRQ8_9ASTR